MIYIDRIEGYKNVDFSLSVENAKALLESIAKEICEQKNQVLTNTESIGKLLGLSFGCLGYSPTDTTRQIGTAIANIGTQMGSYRNEIGATSHGKTLQEFQRRDEIVLDLTGNFLLNATEIVSCFLIEAFEADNPLTKAESPKPHYEDNDEFNEFIDSVYGEFKMTEDYTYTASEILYFVDNDAYVTELIAFKSLDNETNNGE